MSIKKIVAIIDELQLEKVENNLTKHGVTGFTIHPVKGRGKYCNTFSRDGLVTHVQIEIYTGEQHANKIAKSIMQIADVGADSEGLVAITSVDELFWIGDQKPAAAEEFNFFEV
jgi:nitrogen regulatory protein PII